jgi:ribosome biogenesis protein SSF1/2
MRDYVGVAGQLGVSHLLFFSQTEAHLILRIARNPDGPTLHFIIQQFYLPRQIKSLQKRPFESTAACKPCSNIDRYTIC